MRSCSCREVGYKLELRVGVGGRKRLVVVRSCSCRIVVVHSRSCRKRVVVRSRSCRKRVVVRSRSCR